MDENGMFTAALLCASAKGLAAGTAERQIARQPEAADYGPGSGSLVADTEVRLGYLAEAVATNRPALFSEQVAWLKVLVASRGVSLDLLHVNLESMREELAERLPAGSADRAVAILDEGLKHFAAAPTELPSYLEANGPHIDLARRFLLAVLETREADATALILEAAQNGIPHGELHEHVLGKVQREIGRMWQMAEVTVAEEHMCTDVVTSATTLLRAQAKRAAPNGKRVIAAAVGSESHDLGPRFVSLEFEQHGWNAVYLGAGTPAVAIIAAVRDFGCDLIALSTSIVLYVRETAEAIQAIRADADCKNIPVIVGGAPYHVVDDLWKVVGADGYAPNAVAARELADELVGAGS